MAAEFVHLHVHTQYSFLTSSVRLGALPKRAKELGMTAVAMTDAHNMFGAIQHYKKCKAEGITPILGAELNVVRGPGAQADHLVLLATNEQGYKNTEVDALLKSARHERDRVKRFEIYRQAEQKILDDAAIIPDFWPVEHLLVKPCVKNWPTISMTVPKYRFLEIDPKAK